MHQTEYGTLHVGDVRDCLREVPDGAAHCCVTSPPYWGLRDYGVDWQLGLEPTPEAYVANMVEVFRAVWRVLRDDGTLWLNLGDSYARAGGWSDNSGLDGLPRGESGRAMSNIPQEGSASQKLAPGLKPKDLVGIPWRVAFALQADGWYLRSDIIWCLSGGTYLYARTQKGEGVCMVRDLARLDPSTVELWNGEKWTRLLGMSKSARRGDELEITLMSGERVSCTPTHKWPTRRGLVAASELVPGDVICKATLPEPDCPRDCAVDEDAAWLAGLYIAEGSRSGHTMQIAGHSREEARWERLVKTAAKYGGYATRTVAGNTMSIRLYGKVLFALIDELVTGKTAKDKAFAPVVWRYSNRFIAAMVDGYLSGDGHYDASNKRWRLGFTRNYNLERDLRTACARLGYKLSLKLAEMSYNGRMVKTFRGELRKATSGHHNEHDTAEIVRIAKAKCREVYDLGVEDEPHLFALASGVLTHNSKPNPMPESVTDRPTKAHEYLFLLTKRARYYYDAEAVKEPSTDRASGNKQRRMPEDIGRPKDHLGSSVPYTPDGTGRNRRTVWTVATEPFSGAHFATFPRKLIEPCILAGTSAKGCCPACGAPWQRVVERGNSEHHCRPGCGCGRGEKSGDQTKQDWSESWKGYGGFEGTARDTGKWMPTCVCGCDEPGVRPDDWEIVETPTGERVGEDPTITTGRAGFNRPRHPEEGSHPRTRYEQRKYAAQLKASPHRADMECEAGPAFAHYIRTDASGARPVPHYLLTEWLQRGWLEPVSPPAYAPPDPIPCTVLDPFLGSGTTACVALEHGRRWLGVELNPDYAAMALERIASVQPPLPNGGDHAPDAG